MCELFYKAIPPRNVCPSCEHFRGKPDHWTRCNVYDALERKAMSKARRRSKRR